MGVRFKPDDPYFIYGLVDPRTDKVRYVGKTYDLKGRLRSHMWCALHPEGVIDPESYKHRWIRKLHSLGIKPTIKLLEETIYSQANDREKYWIKFYGRENLTNNNDGGDDPKYFKNISIYDYTKLHENRYRICEKLKYFLPKEIKDTILNYIQSKSMYDSLDDFTTANNQFDKNKFLFEMGKGHSKAANHFVKIFNRMNNIEEWLKSKSDIELFTILVEYKLGSYLYNEFGGKIYRNELRYASEFITENMKLLHHRE